MKHANAFYSAADCEPARRRCCDQKLTADSWWRSEDSTNHDLAKQNFVTIITWTGILQMKLVPTWSYKCTTATFAGWVTSYDHAIHLHRKLFLKGLLYFTCSLVLALKDRFPTYNVWNFYAPQTGFLGLITLSIAAKLCFHILKVSSYLAISTLESSLPLRPVCSPTHLFFFTRTFVSWIFFVLFTCEEFFCSSSTLFVVTAWFLLDPFLAWAL